MRLLMEEIGFRLYLMENSSLRTSSIKVVGIFYKFFRGTDIQFVLKVEFLIDIIFHKI